MSATLPLRRIVSAKLEKELIESAPHCVKEAYCIPGIIELAQIANRARHTKVFDNDIVV